VVDKAASEAEADHQKFEMLLGEKNEQVGALCVSGLGLGVCLRLGLGLGLDWVCVWIRGVSGLGFGGVSMSGL